MSDTGWHRHDSGTVHRDDAGCTWLGNPVPCEPPAGEPGLTDFLLARIAEDEAWALDVEFPSDPRRALAECEAKRQIVEHHRPYHVGTANDGLNWDYTGCINCEAPDGWEPDQGDWFPCFTLRALASIYADHPDYDEEWKP